jgi:hypothetical protein
MNEVLKYLEEESPIEAVAISSQSANLAVAGVEFIKAQFKLVILVLIFKNG